MLPLRKCVLGSLAILCALIGGLFASSYVASKEPTKPTEFLGPVRPVKGRICGLDFAPYNPLHPLLLSPQKLKLVRQRSRSIRGTPSGLREAAAVSLLSSRLIEATEVLENVAGGGKDARILSDLSAVYLERAQKEGDAHFLILAITANSRALTRDPKLLEALFNRALILETAGLYQSARQGWRQYLKRDPYSPWAQEAQAHWWRISRTSLRANWKSERLKLTDADSVGSEQLVHSIVGGFPEFARLYAEEELLGEWADAKLANQVSRAAQILNVLRSIGAELASAGRDQLVQRTVSEIRQAEEDGKDWKLDSLAEGLILYRRGLASFKSDDFDTASRVLWRSFVSLHNADSKFSSWPLLYLAICDYYKSDYKKALKRLKFLISTVDSEKYPALAGRIWWIEGLVLYSRSELLEALSAHISALSFFRRARESMHEGYACALVAADLAALGERQEAWKYRFKSLSVLPEIDDPRRIYSILEEAARGALEEGQFEAALNLFNELLAHINSQSSLVPAGALAETFARRAVALGKVGRNDLALSGIERARKFGESIEDNGFRHRVSADLNVAEAELKMVEEPREAVRLLTSALSFYSVAGYRTEIAEVLARRAATRQALGDREAAKLDLEAGILEYERQRNIIGADLEAADYFNQVQGLFDRIIEMELYPTTDAEKAFAYAERARLARSAERAGSVWHLNNNPNDDGLFARVQSSLPPRAVLIEYIVLPDRLLMWSFGRRVIFTSTGISEEELANLVERFRFKILSGGDVRSEAARLYELLIRPMESLIESRTSYLVIVPDKSLQGVPYSALLDSRTERFLVEKLPVILASSCYQFLSNVRAGEGAPSGSPRALVIDASGVSSGLSPLLPSLKAAGEEVRAIANLYPESLVLQGNDATAIHFLESAPSYEVIHFSGHALSEPNPAFSALVLSGREGTADLLRAKQITKIKFRKAQIVILGACSTAVGSPPRDGGINLAEAFVRAGVSSVVASLWRVDDRSTATLLKSFHALVVKGYRASEALRLSQIKLLESDSPQLRGPSSWAGFELIGGDASIRQN